MSAALDWVDVDSSNVKRVAHVDEFGLQDNVLCVEFTNGGLYTYHGVDYNTYQELIGANSVGQYLNNNIKGLYTYNKWQDVDDLENGI